ncbi:MAG: hypothetical protein ACE5KV_08160 [Thermoplasmata archaeon]
MPKKDKDELRRLNVPWITKDGHLDVTQFPLEVALKQSLSKERSALISACTMLTWMFSAGRTEAVVFLYGLLILNRNDLERKEVIVRALGDVETPEAADLLFTELNRTESSRSTRTYINAILKSLSGFPLHLVEDGFHALINDARWSYKMKRKFREILDRIEYKC